MKMTNHWQELRPADRYLVSSAGLLHDFDRKIITLLYQPLIGPICVSLYMTFWSEMEENRLWSKPSLHYQLMNTIGLHLNEIYEARIKLEGIGLLSVYKKESEEGIEFVYELNPPLSPEQFFTDGMLNIYLYKKIGKTHFNSLKQFFSDEKISVNSYQQVTKSFTEIFASDHLDSLYVSDEAKVELDADITKRFFGRESAKDLGGFSSQFDFDLLFAGIKSLVPRKAFTVRANETIIKLSFLYGIDALQMQKLVIGSVTPDQELDLEELRKAARDWYQIEYHQDMPTLIERVQPLAYRSQQKEPLTQEEQLIRHLETVSPRVRLIQLSGGAEPSKADLQILEGIMLNQNLNPGVVNVLVEYVMLKTDMKLSKAYIEKIASHWTRKNVVTVKEAMELAKSEHRQYQEWAKTKNEPKSKNRKATRTEMVPEWMNESENAKESPHTKDMNETQETDDLDERKRKLEENLKKLKNRR
jgi:replication initiation and membrane attachment protein